MATVALLIWPLAALGFFAALGPSRGLIWTCLIGFLFLPEYEAFDLPALPPYGKYTVISLALFLGVLVSQGAGGPKPLTSDKTMRFVMLALIAGLFLGLVGTIMDNTQALNRGGRFQSGHSIRDLISLGSEILIFITPFLLARRWLSDPKYHADLLFAVVALALVYSLLVVFEARMSPQLNSWIYGFFPHSWRQHVRGGGFRPIVFLSHGLSVGFFLFAATTAAFAMVRHTTGKQQMLFGLAGVWILMVLILSRNLGAVMLVFMFVPALLVLGRRMVMLIATGAALLFMVYPVARTALPTDQLLTMIGSVSAERAQSLEFRLEHEDALIERAAEKPVFGWGGWGRNRVIDDQGRDLSVTDGAWVLQLGGYGWVGYITYFGLIAASIGFLRRRADVSFASVGLALILAGALIYSIPNAEINPFIWLMAGSLSGYLQFGTKGAAAQTEDADASPDRHMVYTRFEPKTRESKSQPYSRNF